MQKDFSLAKPILKRIPKCCEKHRPSWRWQQLGNTPKFFAIPRITKKDYLLSSDKSKGTYEKLHIVLGVVNDKSK
jgi:hypothetical protein